MTRLTAHLASATLTLAGLCAAPDAFAQSRGSQSVSEDADIEREIVRGYYLRANAGSLILFGPRSAVLRPGTTIDLTVGQDVHDTLKASAGWEINLTQSIFNASIADYRDLIGSNIDPRHYVQGNTQMLGITAGGGGQYYPVRRLGIGGHAGAGIAYFPLLIHNEAWQTRVVPEWGGFDPGLYNSVKFMAYGGATLEYYTKLSHFSFGINADFVYILGFDFGLKAGGFFKYTF